MCWPFSVWCLGIYLPLIIQSRCQRCQVLQLSVAKSYQLTANIILCLKRKTFPFLIVSVDKHASDVRQSDVIITGTRSGTKKFQVSCVSWNTTLSPWKAHLYTNHLISWAAIDRYGAQRACSAVTARKMPLVEIFKWKIRLGWFPWPVLPGGSLSSEMLLQRMWVTLVRNLTTQMHSHLHFSQSGIAFMLSDKRHLWLRV